MKKLFTLLMISLTLVLNSCDKDDDSPKDCGCNSETNYTITETDSLIGEMFYKKQTDNPLDTYYNNLYWIKYTLDDCSNCINSMIVCNEEFLNNEFEDIITSGEIVEVIFSGELKSVCDKGNNPADYTFNRIILTSIERQ